MGAVTPFGGNVSSLWSGLIEGRDAIRPLDRFDLGEILCRKGGQVDPLPPTPVPGNSASPLADPAARFAIAALAEACRDAGLDAEALRGETPAVGLAGASNFGAVANFAADIDHRPPSSRPFRQGDIAGALAARLGLRGPRSAISLSCGAGAAALAWAAGLIRHGRAQRMLVVGFDALSPFSWFGLCALRTMTRDRVRPFDRNRSGTLFSEGAAALVLEANTSAQARGAVPLAELEGWATNCNAHHLTAPAPRGEGTARVLRDALASARRSPGEVDHYNAHGTGTRPNDLTESQALADVFGEHLASLPVTSIKASLGHMMGAAGVVEAIASVFTLREGLLPPTTNFETPDPECPVDLVANRPREARVHRILSNSAGIGGNNAALVIARI